MAASDDEDDTHFCIKCHATMRGLDTYVAHRRAKCRPEREKRAHDFFSSLNLQSSSKTFWQSSSTNDATDDQERRKIPPPGHTGGKWKPETERSHEVRTQVPPPGHTRGKWGPAERPWGQLQKGYWCGPCNRRLSSSVVYERHIKSELHFKRTKQWPQQENTVLRRRTRVRTKAILASSLRSINRRFRRAAIQEKQQKELKRKKKGGTMVCESCRCKVWPHLIGKHLVSYYHYKHRRPGAETLVIQNMESVVRQAPFQCGLCKFYTNTVRDLLDHWTSDMHRQNDLKLDGKYWCCICKCNCDSSVAMGYHMNSESHNEMVSVINKSVPIVIQKQVQLQCEVCSRSFRFNMELKAHARNWGHQQSKSTASDNYQEVTACEDCEFRGHSLDSYQRHLRMKHGKEIHFCRRCDARFGSAEEARQHRREAEHREAGAKRERRCQHCFLTLRGLAALKEHLLLHHPDRRHRCLRCGQEFILKQELSQHVKTGLCSPGTTTGAHKCLKCQFSTDLETDLLLHNILHGEPDNQQRYSCLYCDKAFKKETLRNHVKVHSIERNFVCQICDLSFSRRDALSNHTARVHEKARCIACRLCAAQFATSKLLSRHMTIHHERTKNFACPECSSTFYDKASLEKHIQRHLGKKFPCPEEGCIFKGRSEAELRTHRNIHGEARDFHCRNCTYSAKTKCQLSKHIKSQHTESVLLTCPHCDFTTKNRTHLRRHTNLHYGQKPFKCPHCSFSCSLLENLRKHVITSKLHPGKFLYECPYCDNLKTNLAKELKAHLVSTHGRSPVEVSSHISGLYRREPEVSAPQSLVPVPANRRKKTVTAGGRDQEEERLPTLASVALNNEEDVIFIEVAEELESVLYQPADGLEAYPTDRV